VTDAAALEGVPWVLASGLDVEGWEEAPPSATFEGGTVAGSTGCNRFTASYALDRESLRLGALALTLMACLPPRDAVERAYVAALEQVAACRVEDGELTLHDANGGELLRFAPATLVGKWIVAAFQRGTGVSSTLADTEISAVFADDGTLVGSGGCNVYRTKYSTDGGSIEIAPPFATRKACAQPEGVMEQEAAYLDVLPRAARYRLDGSSLRLLTAEGTIVAALTRATRSPGG
jgi:heat shock protein HslJ